MFDSPQDEQAVIIDLDSTHLPKDIYERHPLAALEDQLVEALSRSGSGEYDGSEVGPSETTLYFYGANAEALYRTIEPVVKGHPLCQGARVLIRRGGPEVAGREFRLPRKD